jgi:hypothetical protein
MAEAFYTRRGFSDGVRLGADPLARDVMQLCTTCGGRMVVRACFCSGFVMAIEPPKLLDDGRSSITDSSVCYGCGPLSTPGASIQ